ncbi:MAG: type I toxin-antitoxin system Fst family toxin [Enterococcus faecalis]|nr:type I toxin-antitoxin system Fst family toxin [Staphylococcus epidermidis]MDU1594498.1 type I toxin-antitoxin system Fst family toxin [Staphylococcus lugdunensis]MDU6237280.1 type I toxin-antitoxin system Fst family toxin [Enterococcus faecalis]HBH2479933.1 type I toxin-antitoxin system Fst family toxin [Clostridioides difficile]MCG1126292.1 type I toxin-antitoxin system Fst family toxin [Staphylococcus epidermidis]MCG2198360.1 type I toxin-antitoxin system Fst family toxin [Staphylococcus
MLAIFVYITVSIFIECCVALFKFWLDQRNKK